MNAVAWLFLAAFIVTLVLLACALIGGNEIRDQLRRRIAFLELQIEGLTLPDDVFDTGAPMFDELAVARLRKGLDEWGQR